MREIQDLLQGAIDMHVHSWPDVSLAHPQHRTNDDVSASAAKLVCRELYSKHMAGPRQAWLIS